MNTIEHTQSIPLRGKYDIIVSGGGLAGVAAAVSAARLGKKVLLLEKNLSLGGLATIGMVNFFVPMCNGRGHQIIKGMAEEFFQLSIQYGYNTFPKSWKEGNPTPNGPRYVTYFSAPLFMLALTELIAKEGITILYDTLVTDVVMKGAHCEGVVVHNKSGAGYFEASMFVDTTGDGDLLVKAGMPTTEGGDYNTFFGYLATLETCQRTIDTKDFSKLALWSHGGNADLYGNRHPQGKPLWKGTCGQSVSEYVVENHLALLEKMKNLPNNEGDLLMLPSMPQFRTTRHLDGNHCFDVKDAYTHFEDSIAAICDFDRRDFLYEVPYGTLVKNGFDNIITAGRCASATGYGWDVLRVIPPAILTGQAAGIACVNAIEENLPIYAPNLPAIQKELTRQKVSVHFDDALVPSKNTPGAGEKVDIGHS